MLIKIDDIFVAIFFVVVDFLIVVLIVAAAQIFARTKYNIIKYL